MRTSREIVEEKEEKERYVLTSEKRGEGAAVHTWKKLVLQVFSKKIFEAMRILTMLYVNREIVQQDN